MILKNDFTGSSEKMTHEDFVKKKAAELIENLFRKDKDAGNESNKYAYSCISLEPNNS